MCWWADMCSRRPAVKCEGCAASRAASHAHVFHAFFTHSLLSILFLAARTNTNTQVTSKGAFYLAEGLATSGVRELHLGNNNIQESGAAALRAAADDQRRRVGFRVQLLGIPTAAAGE